MHALRKSMDSAIVYRSGATVVYQFQAPPKLWGAEALCGFFTEAIEAGDGTEVIQITRVNGGVSGLLRISGAATWRERGMTGFWYRCRVRGNQIHRTRID